MKNKKKKAVSALKKAMTTTKVKTVKKKPVMSKKTRQEIEELFAASLSCDCSHCAHHCSEKK